MKFKTENLMNEIFRKIVEMENLKKISWNENFQKICQKINFLGQYLVSKGFFLEKTLKWKFLENLKNEIFEKKNLKKENFRKANFQKILKKSWKGNFGDKITNAFFRHC